MFIYFGNYGFRSQYTKSGRRTGSPTHAADPLFDRFLWVYRNSTFATYRKNSPIGSVKLVINGLSLNKIPASFVQLGSEPGN